MSLLDLMNLLRKKMGVIIALPLACAAVTAACTFFLMEDEYTSEVQLYVLTQSNTSQDKSYVSSSDTAASQQLANDIAVLAGSNTVRTATAKALHMSSLSRYSLNVKSESNNRVVTLSVTATDPNSAKLVADQLAKQTSLRSVEIMGLKAVNIIDEATTPTKPSGPNRPIYIIVALLAGLLAAVAIVVVSDMLDTTVKSREQAESLYGLPILGVLPEMKKVK